MIQSLDNRVQDLKNETEEWQSEMEVQHSQLVMESRQGTDMLREELQSFRNTTETWQTQAQELYATRTELQALHQEVDNLTSHNKEEFTQEMTHVQEEIAQTRNTLYSLRDNTTASDDRLDFDIRSLEDSVSTLSDTLEDKVCRLYC